MDTGFGIAVAPGCNGSHNFRRILKSFRLHDAQAEAFDSVYGTDKERAKLLV